MPGPTLGGTLPPVHHSPDEETQKLEPGAVLSDRYQVIDILGVGGMGSVYKAFDRRLARVVALKTILPELAASPVMMKRFKQEVLLAQKITHKNVVRIFDIGEDQGTAFITMDFIEGESLKDAIQKRGKFPANEAVAIIREVARALEAAHSEGVVHRDLKPQNIMIEKSGRIVVMDFGIARSAESGGATQTGALLGTPDYMSPEQARMEEVDARSDIFSLGLIFYELLTGKLAFSGKTIVETMFIRTKERAIPPAEIERSIPEGSNNIAVKCLEPDVAKRYQSVTDMLADLESFDPTKKVGASVLVKSRLRKIYPYRAWVAAAAAVLILLVGGYVLRDGFGPTPTAQPKSNVSVFITDFANQTGEPIFDNALEPVIKLALEEASFISAFDRRTPGFGLAASDRIDEVNGQKIATTQGLGFVVSGSVEQKGSAYVISVKAIEAFTGKAIHIDDESASGKDKVLPAATKLAAAIRVALGDDTSQRFAQDTLSASSREAVHEYAIAMNFLSGGNSAEALKSFSKAVELDKDFGLAYAGMAVTSNNMRRTEDAAKYIDLALKKIDRMTEREKLRTRAYSFSVAGNRKACAEEYTTLIQRFPADVAARNNLANCLTQMREMKRAIEEVSQAMEILPKGALYRNNLALYLSYASDFKTAEQRAQEVQDRDPNYGTGFVSLAFAQLGQDRPDEARQTYEKLQQVTGEASAVARNASRATGGIADVALYSGRYNEAIRILQQGADQDLKAPNSREPAAMKLSALADTLLLKGRKSEAVSAAERALEASQSIKIRFRAGMVFAGADQEARVREMIDKLSAETQPEPRSYAQILEGEIALRKGDFATAETKFTDAIGLLDTWIGHFQLGRAYLEKGAYLEADSHFSACFRRRGEAMALFLDESPTYGYFPLVHYYLGRAREGMKTDSFADSYRTYLSIRGKAGEDPLLAEVKKKTD
jgi:serine/threonine protein kinase/tetratricopeptide (TPR) repeat protein